MLLTYELDLVYNDHRGCFCNFYKECLLTFFFVLARKNKI